MSTALLVVVATLGGIALTVRALWLLHRDAPLPPPLDEDTDARDVQRQFRQARRKSDPHRW